MQARADAARIQTLEAQVRELKSSELSEKRHDVTHSQRDAPLTVQMDRAVAAAMKRTDEVFMRQVFERHASSRGVLSAAALISALQDVDAPMLHTSSSSASLENDIFRRVDANMNGLVDFDECEASPPAVTLLTFLFALTFRYCRFMRAAQLPGDLEMLLEENQLSVRARRGVSMAFIII